MTRPTWHKSLNRTLNRLVGRWPRFAHAYWRVGGAGDEVEFWTHFMATKGAAWPEDYARRLDPTTGVIDPVLRDRVKALADSRIDLLEVGAGPVTSVGYVIGNRELSITAVDPLAREYDRILNAQGLTPPVRTIPGTGEQLVDQFGEARFHVAYARNSLDHSPEPIRIIEQMLRVVKPAGVVVLRHFRNEGEKATYEGLHQWNFDVSQSGALLVWNRGVSHNVNDEFAGRADVRAWQEEPNWVLAVLMPQGS